METTIVYCGCIYLGYPEGLKVWNPAVGIKAYVETRKQIQVIRSRVYLCNALQNT